jgi:hypothetical protein
LAILTTLRPSQPLVRHIDAGSLLSQLPDGKYGVRIEPQGMWWCVGDIDDFAATGEDRVSHYGYKRLISPLMVQCKDIVEIQVENGATKW